MKKLSKYKKILFVIFVMIISFSVFEAQASWLIKNFVTADETLIDSSDTDYFNVYIKYVSTQVVTTGPTNGEKYDEFSYSSSTNSTAASLYNTYQSVGVGEYPIGDPNENYSNNEEGNKVIEVTQKYIYIETISRNGGGWFLDPYKYTISGYYFDKTTIRSIKRIADYTNNKYSYKVKKGEKMQKPIIEREGFAFMGYLSASSDGNTIKNEIFDFSKPINEDTYIFAEWIQITEENSNLISALTAHVNNATGISNIYPSSAATFDLNNDISYNSLSGYVELGSSSLVTTIKSDVTINFALASGKTDQEATEGASITDVASSTASNDKYISLDYTNTANIANTKDYEIVLQNDLVVYGNMVIGGITGATTASTLGPQGHIMSNYVKLDLNGHNLYIKNGGTVHSFGYIDDSVGTGKVIVEPNGKLKTPFVVYAIKGGNHTLWAYSKGVPPFEHYVIPYVNCKVEIITNSSGSGCLDIFTKFNLGSLGFTNFYLHMFGNNSSTNALEKYFIQTNLKSGTEGKITITPHQSRTLKENNISNVINKNMVYLRNHISFNNLNCIMNNVSSTARVFMTATLPVINREVTIDRAFELALDRLSFPISPSWDFEFINSFLNVSQNLTFLPGSTMTLDKNSILELDYYKGSGTTASKRVFDPIPVEYLGFTIKKLPGDSKYISGGIFAIDENITNVQNLFDSSLYGLYEDDYNNYWKYYKSANINIYGKINFKMGNNAPYKLAGNININSYSVDGGSSYNWNIDNMNNLVASVNIQTYDIEISAVNFVWFSGKTESYKDQTCNANRYFTLPLISKGNAYMVDQTTRMIGKWNAESGIFYDASGDTYFLKTSNQILISSSDRTSQLDLSVEPTKCTINSDHTVESLGVRYVYYAGYMAPYYAKTSNGDIVIDVSKLSNKFSAENTAVNTKIIVVYGSVPYNGRIYNTWKKTGSYVETTV